MLAHVTTVRCVCVVVLSRSLPPSTSAVPLASARLLSAGWSSIRQQPSGAEPVDRRASRSRRSASYTPKDGYISSDPPDRSVTHARPLSILAPKSGV